MRKAIPAFQLTTGRSAAPTTYENVMVTVQPLFSEAEIEAIEKVMKHLSKERSDYAALSPDKRPAHIYSSALLLQRCGFLKPETRVDLGRI